MITEEQIKNWHDNREFDEIIAAITNLNESDVDDRLLGSLAAAYSNSREFDKAVETLNRTSQVGKDDPLWHYRMAFTLFFKKDYATAKVHFERSKEGGEQDTTPFLTWIDGYEKLQGGLLDGNNQLSYSELDPDLYLDIQDTIFFHFDFLKHFGFGKFIYHQMAHENHFVTNNEFCKIDIWFESIHSSPISILINGYQLVNIELQNTKIEQYHNVLKDNYDDLFQLYLAEDDTSYLRQIASRYNEVGRKINDDHLREMSDVLKRHVSLLHGDLELLMENTNIVAEKEKKKVEQQRTENKIYTMEYQFEGGNGMVFEDEFEDLDEIKEFMEDNDDIEKYTIRDWNKLEVEL